MVLRKIWLKNPATGEIWDLLPQNPQSITGGCPLINPAGLGYSQSVTQNQVNVDFFIEKINSEAKDITGTLYFKGSEHIDNFSAFVRDFSAQLLLCYSPDGSVSPATVGAEPWYKPITIVSIEKGETNGSGWYACKTVFRPQSAVWHKDHLYTIQDTPVPVGDALVYPWIYPYVFGGADTVALEINNPGRECGVVISVKNNDISVIPSVEIVREAESVNAYGETVTSYQRAKFYAALQQNYTFTVDSRPVTQKAIVTYPDESYDSVVSLQEPSWDYINFITLLPGTNRLIFSAAADATITVSYTESREVI